MRISLPYGLLYSSSYSNLHLAPNRTCKLNSGRSFQNYSSSFPSISNANSIFPMHCPNLESPTTSFFFSYQSIIKIGFKIGLSFSDVTIFHPVKATIILSLDYSNSLTIITDYFLYVIILIDALASALVPYGFTLDTAITVFL